MKSVKHHLEIEEAMKNKSVQGHRGWPRLGADDLLSKPVQLPSGVGTYQHRLLLDGFLLFWNVRD